MRLGIRPSLLTPVIGKEKVEPRAAHLLGAMFSNKLDRTLLCLLTETADIMHFPYLANDPRIDFRRDDSSLMLANKLL